MESGALAFGLTRRFCVVRGGPVADCGPAAEVNLKLGAGASFRLSVQYPVKTPTDLSTGYTAHLQARKHANDVEALLDVRSDGVDPAIVLSAGRNYVDEDDKGDPNIVITLTPALTLPLADAGPLVYDLLLTRSSDSYVRWLLAGTIHVSGLVTRES